MDAGGYERLSAQDRSFLVFERAGLPMHLGALVILEGGPLLGADGRLDLRRLRSHVRARLHLAPRYRQRLSWVPLLERPVWIDDARFDLRRHVRHVRVSDPGDADGLKRLAGRLFSLPLDRMHPLWELWAIDGLGSGRFALLVKTHHAMADGISAFGLFAALLSASPECAAEPVRSWRARPAPSALALLRDQLAHELAAPAGLGLELARTLARPAELPSALLSRIRAVGGLLGFALRPPARTPLNRPLGPHRAFDWLRLDLSAAMAVKTAAGGSLNDVILATVAGALRSFLGPRAAAPGARDYRVVVPVSLRSQDDAGRVENRVSAWLTHLPLDEPDPIARLRRVQRATRRLKAQGQAGGPDLLMRMADRLAPGLVDLGVRLTAWLHPYNLIVSNVRGPAEPLYLYGARLRAAYPQVPLFEHQGVGVALFSVDSHLCWGFHADPALVPDLPRLVDAARTAFEDLRRSVTGAGAAIDLSAASSPEAGAATNAPARTRRERRPAGQRDRGSLRAAPPVG